MIFPSCLHARSDRESAACSEPVGHQPNRIGGGFPVGSVEVGAEIGMTHTRAAVQVMLYDGRTLEHLRTLDLHSQSSSPSVTGVGLGGRNSFLFLRLPLRKIPERRVTRDLARSAAAQIAAP